MPITCLAPMRSFVTQTRMPRSTLFLLLALGAGPESESWKVGVTSVQRPPPPTCQLPAVTVCGPHLEERYRLCPSGGRQLVRVLVDAEFTLVDGCPTLVRERVQHVKDLSLCP